MLTLIAEYAALSSRIHDEPHDSQTGPILWSHHVDIAGYDPHSYTSVHQHFSRLPLKRIIGLHPELQNSLRAWSDRHKLGRDTRSESHLLQLLLIHEWQLSQTGFNWKLQRHLERPVQQPDIGLRTRLYNGWTVDDFYFLSELLRCYIDLLSGIHRCYYGVLFNEDQQHVDL